MKTFEKEKKEQEKRYTGLINLIMDYAIENTMTLDEIDECMDKVVEVFYRDAVITR